MNPAVDLERTIDDAVTGAVTLDRLSEVVTSVRDLFARPSVSGEHPGDDAGEGFAIWQALQLLLAEHLNRLLREVRTLELVQPEQAMRILQVVERAVPLLTNADANRSSIAFQIGYFLSRRRHYREAALHFLAAETSARNNPEMLWNELVAASFAANALNDSAQFEEGLAVAERLLARARALHNRPVEAIALRACSLAQAGLGREGAVEHLEGALNIVRTVEDREREEYSLPDQSVFLNDLGVVSRARGSFDIAIRAFTELIERRRANGEAALEARATSELAYTYHAAGERQRAAPYLAKAADLAEKAASRSTPDSRRWRLHADAFAGTSTVASFDFEAGPITSATMAYELGVAADVLTQNRACEQARGVAERVVAWARDNHDATLEMGQLNNLAACEIDLGHVDQAIRHYREGIRLADGLKVAHASLALRQGLAHAYLAARKNHLAVDVLWGALAEAEALLATTPSTEVRQQISAGVLNLHETLASLMTRNGHFSTMVGATEMARSRNLLGWMRTSAAVAARAHSSQAQRLLNELRRIEVEFEVRQLHGNATAEQVAAILERRTELRGMLNEQLAAVGAPPLEWVVDAISDLHESNRLMDATAQGDAALSLFCADDGICAAVVRADIDGPTFDGAFLAWTRADRNATIALGPTDDGARAVLHESLFKPLGELLRRKGIHNLVVVPQAELALVPYWELLETGQLSGAVCVAPSLNVHRMCTKQHRDGEGLTVLTPDITGSLLHSFAELRAVAERRSGEHRRCSTAREILDAAPSAAVLHIAAHGVFNADNPYLGGVIVNESEPADDWSRQYVAAPRRFSADMKPDAWPLMTVATCMANLRLDRCRLAVLSTCESGVPRLHGGGEMTGLPSALLLAGAKSVIASLWRVHDEATAVLMHHFYEVSTLGRGPIDGVALALKEARRRLGTTTSAEAETLLGSRVSLNGEHPFADPFFTDAFQCFGSF